MGTRGPIGKRSEERRRRNKTDTSGNSNEAEQIVVDESDFDQHRVDVPDPDPGWGVYPMMMYESVKNSAVSFLYEPSDWAVLFVALDQLDRNLQPQAVVVQAGPRAGEVIMVDQPMNGSILAGLMKTFGSLMLTEGDRRRLKLEIERTRKGAGADTDAQPTGDNVIDIRRERMGG